MEPVERTEELRTLRGIFDEVKQGRGTGVLISGEPGIGKTTLVRSFVDGLEEHIRLLWGSCEDLATPRTLGPFRDIDREAHLLGPGVEFDRDRLIDALLDEMGFAARPLLLVVEDAHWADDASFDVIRYLLRRIAALPAMLILTVRDEEIATDHPLRRIFAGLSHSQLRRLDLAGFSDETVARFASERGLNPELLVSLVNGNPFYLAEVLAAPDEAVPASVRDAVLARVGRLPAGTRSTLELLATIPGEVESALLHKLVAPSALGAALETGLVIRERSGIGFRHELARRAIESGATQPRLIDNNWKVTAALIELGAESARVVHHGVLAHDDETVARFAPLAARSALEEVSYREALAFSLLALERRRFADPVEEALLHGWAARSLFALNRFGAAASQADLAVNLWDSLGERPIELGEALLISSRLSTVLGDPTSARAKSERALVILEPMGPSHALASGFATMGSQAVLQSRFEEGAAWCDRAIALGRELNHLDVVARALCFRGLSKCSRGDESGFDDLRQGIQVADEIDHGDSLSGGANNMAVALIRAGRYAEAETYLDLGERTARAHGLDRALFHTEAQKCEVLMLRGHWGEAEARLRKLLEGPADPGANLVPPLSLLGRIATRTGQPEAESLVDRAWSIASSTGEHHKMARAGIARLEWAVLNQDATIAADVAREVIAQAARTQHVYLRAEALRLLGRLGETVEVFDGCPQPYAASIAGDWRKASAMWNQANNPYERALDLCESPDPKTAFAGLATLDRLGAIATAAWMRRRLRLRGIAGVPRGPRAVTRDNPGRLTKRQSEVVVLMGEGLTNQQIADRLYLSRRTVDNHVAAILTTLGASSRQDAVAKVGS